VTRSGNGYPSPRVARVDAGLVIADCDEPVALAEPARAVHQQRSLIEPQLQLRRGAQRSARCRRLESPWRECARERRPACIEQAQAARNAGAWPDERNGFRPDCRAAGRRRPGASPGRPPSKPRGARATRHGRSCSNGPACRSRHDGDPAARFANQTDIDPDRPAGEQHGRPVPAVVAGDNHATRRDWRQGHTGGLGIPASHRAHRHRCTGAPMRIVTPAWWRLVVRPDKSIDRRAYTFCALQALHAAFKRRDL
jgi:hypothetical protein